MRLGNSIRALIAIFACVITSSANATKPVIANTIYGAQLYTVRASLEKDFNGTLRRVADMGYGEVEFAGLFGHDPSEVRQTLKNLHLGVAGSQCDWKQLRDDPQELITETKKLGSPYLVFAWMPPEQRQKLTQWHWWIAHINKVAAMARKQGIRFAYHAHDFEYKPIDGVRPIDIIMQGLDKRYVDFEIDIYWTTLGGGDPIALFKKYPGRFPLAHVKDMSRTDTSMVDVGDGRIDFPGIFAHAKQAGLKHYLVEHDNSTDPFHTLERSLAYLKSISA
jgi:sugar phosphate isomerase/epimerase